MAEILLSTSGDGDLCYRKAVCRQVSVKKDNIPSVMGNLKRGIADGHLQNPITVASGSQNDLRQYDDYL